MPDDSDSTPAQENPRRSGRWSRAVGEGGSQRPGRGDDAGDDSRSSSSGRSDSTRVRDDARGGDSQRPERQQRSRGDDQGSGRRAGGERGRGDYRSGARRDDGSRQDRGYRRESSRDDRFGAGRDDRGAQRREDRDSRPGDGARGGGPRSGGPRRDDRDRRDAGRGFTDRPSDRGRSGPGDRAGRPDRYDRGGRPERGGPAGATAGRTDRPNDGRTPQPGTGGRGPRSWDRSSPSNVTGRDSRQEPPLDEEITGKELDRSVWRELRTLTKENADGVAKHLVAAATLLEDDPDLALAHAEHAARRAGRVPAVREALGLVRYRRGEFSDAIREFRTAKRLSGSNHLLPYLVDCERGLKRYDRALDLAASPEAKGLAEADNIELAIVVSGVRRDLGQPEAAVMVLRIPALEHAKSQPWAARLFYAYAEAVLATGDASAAREWFVRALDADKAEETDAGERIDELDGIVMTDLLDDDDLIVEESDDAVGAETSTDTASSGNSATFADDEQGSDAGSSFDQNAESTSIAPTSHASTSMPTFDEGTAGN